MDRLGADVRNLEPGDDAVAEQRSDASERYTATRVAARPGQRDAEYDVARRTALEAARARSRGGGAGVSTQGPERRPMTPSRQR